MHFFKGKDAIVYTLSIRPSAPNDMIGLVLTDGCIFVAMTRTAKKTFTYSDHLWSQTALKPRPTVYCGTQINPGTLKTVKTS